MTDRMMTLAEIEQLCREALMAAGASEDNAAAVARSTMLAERDGIRSHGLLYVPIYAEHVRCGNVDGRAKPVVSQPRPGAVAVADPQRSEIWNRGAYLVNGLGHCGACHTARSALGAEQQGEAYLGGAKLRNADLRGANLAGANLEKADLTSARLDDACLDGATGPGAKLARADLSRATMKGTASAPKLLSNCVLLLMACSISAGMLLGAEMPPFFASREASCSLISAPGLVAVSRAAPWAVLLALIQPTGIQTNLSFFCSGSEASHKCPQCGHWASKKT